MALENKFGIKNSAELARKSVENKDIEIKYILNAALTDQINDREVYMKGIDHSSFYEGYVTYKTEEL